MRRIARIWWTCLLLGAAAPAAYAQRTPVPVVNFEAVPVSLSTSKTLTADQVRSAWIAAGPVTHWEVVPRQPGVLEATYRKGNKHTVVVEVTYDAQAYSTRYVSSVNMKYGIEEREASSAEGRLFRNRDDSSALTSQAAKKQAAQFAGHPETPYAKSDPKAVIHPFYERWLHELLDGVRAQLRSIE